MSYLLLYGAGGWTQRWQIPAGGDEQIRTAISQVGHDGTGELSVIDSQSNDSVTLVIAWQCVAAAVIVGTHDTASAEETTGPYP